MSRQIPGVTKDEAFRLWMQGCSYREIRDRTKMSLGAINQMIAEARSKVQDVDQLRELNLVLGRGDSTVYDAMRGGQLLDRVGKLGIGLDGLEGYVKLTERISSEEGVEAERFVESAVKLMDLERQTGKTYEEVVKDFEGRTRQIEGLEAKAKGVEEKIQGVMERKAQIEREIREAEERLSVTLQELNCTITTQEQLEKLGLERVSELARFIEDFELLGFDANMVRKLATWRKSLADMGIDPDKLGGFIKEKGPLEKQISKLRMEKSARERKVKQVKAEHTRLWRQMTSLRDEVLRLSNLGRALKAGRLGFPCRFCQKQGVSIDITSIENAMIQGSWCSGMCIFCGQWSGYTAWEAAWCLAQHVLPAIRPTRGVAQKRA